MSVSTDVQAKRTDVQRDVVHFRSRRADVEASILLDITFVGAQKSVIS